jgi:glycosyltransferase involved in cell wall biosynthesis
MATQFAVHLMTASLSPGDAIGNYCLTLRSIFDDLGIRALLYADHVAPQLAAIARPSASYAPGGSDVLWYHYSIHADNLIQIGRSTGFKVMDFHGVSPPELFAGTNNALAELCRLGEQQLPAFKDAFDLCVAHSEFSRNVLQVHGFRNIVKLPLVVDASRFDGSEDEQLSQWLRKLDYLLFVGRIVPQKGLEHLLKLFCALRQLRPGTKLFLVGGPHLTPSYRRRLDRLARRLRLQDDLLFTGPIADPKMLTSFYRHARFSVFLSEWESFCVPIVESMAFGTPIIGRNTPPIPETMGGGGILVDSDAPEQAAALVAELWEDEKRYSALRQAGHAQADRFTERQLRRGLVQVLEHHLGETLP